MILIEKDYRHYAECDVVMIETDKTEEVGDIIINEHCENEMGVVTKNNVYTPNVFRFDYTGITFRNYKNTALKPIFIYILSSEEIKVGDYISDGYKVWQWKDDSSLLGRKKVIASTDTSLNITKDLGEISKEEILPQLTREFIQNFVDSYNIGKPVKKVLVQIRMTFPITYTKQVIDFEFKVSKENTVTIKIMEEEENNSQKERLYTLEELKKVYWAGLDNISSNGYSGYDRTEWLEKLIKDLK